MTVRHVGKILPRAPQVSYQDRCGSGCISRCLPRPRVRPRPPHQLLGPPRRRLHVWRCCSPVGSAVALLHTRGALNIPEISPPSRPPALLALCLRTVTGAEEENWLDLSAASLSLCSPPLPLPSSLQLKWRRGVFCSRASVPLISLLLSSSLPFSPRLRLFPVSPAARKNHLLGCCWRRYFSGCKLLLGPVRSPVCLFVCFLSLSAPCR